MDKTSAAFANANGSDPMANSTPLIDGPQIYSLEHLIVTTIILGLMILCTIIGNVFVIAAIILEKNLHNVANYLILSLAVSDLMVSSMVMPISAVKEISKVWFLRSEICDMWVSFDVLCCTASILHLVAISIDRYWAVTQIDYIRNRTAKRILIMIAIVWFVAMSISIPPLFGWKDSNDPAVTGLCIISQNHGYTVFSTVGAFYLPTVLMLIIYAKIFSVARRRIRRKRFHKNKQKEQKAARKQTEMTMLTVPRDSPVSRSEVSECPYNGSSGSGDHDNNKNTFKTNGHIDEEEPSTAMLPTQTQTANGEILRAKKQKEKLEMKRERKAARTLAIITGSFIICWLPFFIMALVVPFIRNAISIPPIAESITLWLGYCNSLLNPIIYTIFNPEFRAAFQKILFGKYSKKHRRNVR